MNKHQFAISLLQTGYTTIEVSFPNSVTVAELPFNGGTGGMHPIQLDVYRSQWAKMRNKALEKLALENPATYTYKCKGLIKVGDKVIVDSPKTGMTIANVVTVDANPQIDPEAPFYKWVVQILDTRAYDKQLKKEAEMLEMLENMEDANEKKQRNEARIDIRQSIWNSSGEVYGKGNPEGKKLNDALRIYNKA